MNEEGTSGIMLSGYISKIICGLSFIPYMFDILYLFIQKEKLTLQHSIHIQLTIASIIFSASFLIPIGDETDAFCKLQSVLNCDLILLLFLYLL